jgi:hypothetical protein
MLAARLSVTAHRLQSLYYTYIHILVRKASEVSEIRFGKLSPRGPDSVQKANLPAFLGFCAFDSEMSTTTNGRSRRVHPSRRLRRGVTLRVTLPVRTHLHRHPGVNRVGEAGISSGRGHRHRGRADHLRGVGHGQHGRWRQRPGGDRVRVRCAPWSDHPGRFRRARTRLTGGAVEAPTVEANGLAGRTRTSSVRREQSRPVAATLAADLRRDQSSGGERRQPAGHSKPFRELARRSAAARIVRNAT